MEVATPHHIFDNATTVVEKLVGAMYRDSCTTALSAFYRDVFMMWRGREV